MWEDFVNDRLYLQTVPCPHPAAHGGTGEVLQCPEPAGCSDGNCIGLGQKALLSTRVMWQQLWRWGTARDGSSLRNRKDLRSLLAFYVLDNSSPWKLTYAVKIDGWSMKLVPFQGTCYFLGGVTGWAPIGYEWSHFTPINGQATMGLPRVKFHPCRSGGLMSHYWINWLFWHIPCRFGVPGRIPSRPGVDSPSHLRWYINVDNPAASVAEEPMQDPRLLTFIATFQFRTNMGDLNWWLSLRISGV